MDEAGLTNTEMTNNDGTTIPNDERAHSGMRRRRSG